MKTISRLVVVLALVLVSRSGFSEDAVAPTYNSIAASIFQPECNKCHSGAKPAAKLDLTNYQALVSSAFIKSGDPENSILYQQVESGKMPLHGTPLSSDQVEAIYTWIQNSLPQS